MVPDTGIIAEPKELKPKKEQKQKELTCPFPFEALYSSHNSYAYEGNFHKAE